MNKFILLHNSGDAQDADSIRWICIPISEIMLVTNGSGGRVVIEMKDGNVHRPLASFMQVVCKLGVEP